MLVPGDLGFSGLVLVFFLFFFFGPILSFLIQKKWRIAVAKKEEIMRLVAMASEEAARAELEANGLYDDVSHVPRPFKCAVCFCPTTTRCSRCKVVRYCSGKCQIIHWRRGHKEECHPPSTNGTYMNGPGSDDTDQNILLQGNQYMLYGKDLDTENQRITKPSKRSSKRSVSSNFSLSSSEFTSGWEDGRIDDLMDNGEAHIDSKVSDASSLRFSTSATSNASDSSCHRFSTSTRSNEPLVDVCVDEVRNNPSRVEEPLFCDVSSDVVEKTTGINEINSLPPEFIDSVTSVNSSSFSGKLKPRVPSYRPGVMEYDSIRYPGSCINDLDECTVSKSFACPSDFPEANFTTSSSGNDDGYMINEDGDGISPDFGSPSQFLFNPQIPGNDGAYSKSFGNKRSADKIVPSEKMVRNACTIGSLPAKPSRSSDSIYNDQSNDQHLESKGRRSLSSISSDCHTCCAGRRSSTSNVRPLKGDNVHTVATGLSEITSSLPTASNGLKTSVRKVVQQFRVPKQSKHNPFGLGEAAERNNYKMLFPYDLFIKLYNWGKVELRPCGLMNCGNSCYANAVLQCLAFTQPLTAYFLQGLHSKACPRKEWCFTCEFECLIQKASGGNSPLSPIGILSQLQSIGSHLGNGKEEDAHEFLRYAIDTMQSVCLKEAGVYALSPLAEETTLVGLIFGGYLRSKIKCMKCHGKSERHERMMDLTVEIQGDIGTLEEALGKFTATEILDGENKYLCNRCKSYEKAKKKLTVLEAPNVLTIAFKRFQSGKFGKLNKSIRFPEILNLAPYMSGKSDKSHVYRLYGVVVHVDINNAAFSGHYVCYVRNLQGKWFKIDDSMVKPVELERVLSKGAYMLLYSRCSPQPPSFIRNAMVSNDIKMKRERSSEVIATNNCKKDTASRSRFSAAALRAGTSTSNAHRRPENCARGMTSDGFSSFDSFVPFNRRLHPVSRVPIVDSSSDSSSLFSCSDEGSCTTESTRDSTSTDDLSDYIFGESRFGWNSPWRGSDDSDVSCSSPLIRSSLHGNALGSLATNGYPPYTAVQATDANGNTFSARIHGDGSDRLQETGRAPFLYSDTSKSCRKLADHNSSFSCSNSETNLEELGWGNPPLDVKSGVSMRRPTWERTAQTFY